MKFKTLLDDLHKQYLELNEKVQQVEKLQDAREIDQVSEVIKAERTKQGLSQHELAELAGVSYSTISRIEAGHPNARLENIVETARALGLSLWIA